MKTTRANTNYHPFKIIAYILYQVELAIKYFPFNSFHNKIFKYLNELRKVENSSGASHIAEVNSYRVYVQ